MTPDEALALRGDVAGLHVHVGSQLLSTGDARETVAWLNRFLADAEWTPEVLDLGGGLGVPTRPGETAPSIAEFVAALRRRPRRGGKPDLRARPFARRAGGRHALPRRLA